MQPRSIWQRIGPAFIVGACIIGPGSVTVMSTTGGKYGYSMLWLSLLAGVLMAGFLAVFMRFGIHCEDTFLGLTRKKLGAGFAVLCGISLFLVDATFQFGNALGVTAGMHALWPGCPKLVWPVLFTSLAIIFLFGCKHIYRHLEKMMTFFLVFMFLAFLINLVMAKPDMAAAARGAVVPTIPEVEDTTELFVTLCGLVATTFVIVCAFFQSYTVKAKGWHDADLASGITDTVLASVMFTLVGTVIMMTAASVLHPKFVSGEIDRSVTVSFPMMISQLETAFPGGVAKVIFGVGFWAAAFSSFVTNSCIGGVLLNDGLGLGGKLESLPTKVCATLVLLIGMSTGMYILHVGAKAEREALEAAEAAPATVSAAEATQDEPEAKPQPQKGKALTVRAIRVGQAATLLAVPLGVVAMIVVLFDKRAFKGGMSLFGKAFVLFGAVVLLGVAALMYLKIQPEIVQILGGG